MTVRCRTLFNMRFDVDYEQHDKVIDLKEKITQLKGPEFPSEHMQLLHKGRKLADPEADLSSCNFDDIDPVYVVIMRPSAALSALNLQAPPKAKTPEPIDKELIKQELVEMGFAEDLVVDALSGCDYNKELALEQLLQSTYQPSSCEEFDAWDESVICKITDMGISREQAVHAYLASEKDEKKVFQLLFPD